MATANVAAAAGTAGAAGKPSLAVSTAVFGDLWNEAAGWLLGHFVQIVIATAVAAVLVIAMLGARRLAERLSGRNRRAEHWPATLAHVVAETRPWFMVLFAAKLVDGYADPPALVARTISILFTIAAALQGALWLRELILTVVEHRAGNEHGRIGNAINLIRLFVTVVLFTIATVLILDNLGVNVTGLVAGLGIGGIAIGLAAKGIFDDLFSALSIIFDRPFQRGDSITYDKTSGTVETIGLKSTRIRAVTGEEVVISNTNPLNKELHNMARLARRRIVMTLGVGYYTPAEVCQQLPAMLRGIVEAHDKCAMVRCGIVNFGASTIDVELQFDVRSDKYDEVFAARHEVAVGVLRAFGEAGIDLAFPTEVTVEGQADGRPFIRRPMQVPPEPPAAAPQPGDQLAHQELAPE